MVEADRFHINPETGQPNKCLDGDTCTFGGRRLPLPGQARR